MSREEDHKTLQEECKDAKVAFLRRRKIDRERRVHEVEGRPQAGFCQTVPGVQGGTGKAVESSPRQQRFKASRGNNRAKGKAPWNSTETDSSKTCQWNWTGKRAPFGCYAISGRKETCYRKQPGKRTSVESPKSRRAAVKRHSENRPETVETGRRNETRKAADNRRRNEQAALFEGHRGEYLHNRGWANPENRGLHHEGWAQEDMAAFHRFEENLRHYHCVICKETWPPSASWQQIFSCSRCKRDRKPCRLYSAENDMDPGSVPAELQGLSEVEELLIARAFPIMSIYRKHGGQRGYKGQCTQSPSGYSGLSE